MNSLPPNAPGFSFKTRVSNSWANIELLRQAVIASARAVFDEGMSVAIGTVASELMENAVKYGCWNASTIQTMRVAVRGRESVIEVDVESPSSPAAAAELEKHLAWMRTFTSAEEAYQARILDLTTQPSDKRSRMGLVRIAVDGRCSIHAELSADGLLVVRATIDGEDATR
jgi:anti-sigma regulatory factor (Ser/Thr protein kinase)